MTARLPLLLLLGALHPAGPPRAGAQGPEGLTLEGAVATALGSAIYLLVDHIW